MSYQEIIDKIKPELEKTVNFLSEELAKFRTGRASPALVEDIVVECFGQKFPLKQLAAISIPESRQILIQPWDKSYIEGIVAALSQTGIGASPIPDKDSIRITLPTLTEDYRKSFLQTLSKKTEETKISIRHWREKAWEELQEGFKEGKIREDDKFRGKDELQKLIDEYNEKIEEMEKKKKEEIMQ